MMKPEMSSEQPNPSEDPKEKAKSLFLMGAILGGMDDKSLESVTKLIEAYQKKFQECKRDKPTAARIDQEG